MSAAAQITFSGLREQLLNQVLVWLALALLPSVVFVTVRGLSLGWSPNNTLQLGLYGAYLLLAWQRRRLSYSQRAGLMLGLFWLSGTSSLLSLGLLGQGATTLISCTLLAMLLLSTRVGWLMAGAVALTVGGVGVATLWGGWVFAASYPAWFQTPSHWALSVYHLSVFVGVVAYVLWRMIEVLRAALEQTQTQAQDLRAALARQQGIFASGNVAIAVIKSRRFVEVNDYLARLLGYSVVELVGQPTRLAYLSDSDYDTFGQSLYHALGSQARYATEWAFRHRDGSPVWTYISVSRLQTADPANTEIVMLAIDISERKHIEDAVREREERLRSILASMEDLVFVFDAEGRFLDSHQDGDKHQYRPPAEFIGKFYRDVLPKPLCDQLERAIADLRRNPGQAQRFDYSLTLAEGERWYSASLSARQRAGEYEGGTAVVRDVTDYMRTLQQLREAVKQREATERFAHETLDALRLHLCVLDGDGKILLVNRAWREFAQANGCTLPEWGVGYNYLNVCGETDAAAGDDSFCTRLQGLFRGDIDTFQSEYPCHSPTEKRWFVVHVARFSSAPLRVVVAHENITERKLAEAAVRETAERLRRLSDNLHLGAIYQMRRGPDGHVSFPYVSAGIQRLFGVTPEQVIADADILHRLVEPQDLALLQAAENQSARDLTPFNQIFRQRNVDGELRWVQCRSMPYRHPDGGVVWDGMVLDITAQKHAEQALQESEQRFHDIFDYSPVAYQSLDSQGRFLEVNQAFCDLLGYRAQDLVGKPFGDLWSPATRGQFPDIFSRFTLHGATCGELELVRGNGDAATILLQGRIQRDAEGKFLRTHCVLLDISERKRVEEALRASEARYRSLITAMAEGVVMQNQDGEILTCNGAAERILGLSRDQMAGRTSLDPHWRAVHPDGSAFPGAEHPLPTVLRSGQAQHNVIHGIHRPDGELRWLLVNAEPLFQPGETVPYAAVATFTDITENRNSRNQLEQQRSTLQAVLEHIPVAVMVFAPDGSVLLANRQATTLLGGLHPEAALTDLSRVYGAFMVGTETPYPPANMPLVRALAGEISSVDDMELRRADGARLLLQITGAPVRDESGAIFSSVVVFQDITQRKQTEARIKASEERLRTIIASEPECIKIINREGRVEQMNPAGLAMVEADSLEQVSGQPVIKLVAPEYRQAYIELHQRVIAGEAAQLAYEVVGLKGGRRWLETHAVPMDDHGQRVHLAVMRDITAQKLAEAALIKAREAAEAANQAKSAFLANMSHELRTPLNAVLGFAQILAGDPELGETQRGQVENIRRGGEYLLTLINDILDLAKIEAGRFELFPADWDTQGFFREIEHMFRLRAAQKDLYFRYQAAPALPYTLHCDDKRLRQILMNLLGNAMKFTEHGGVVLRSSYADAALCLEVEDSGVGMAESDLAKIFEPFQQTGTSRYRAQGTGLGLAISRRLVEAMGGTLSVDSTPGVGSVFRVVVPAQTLEGTGAAPAPDPGPAVTGYRRTDSGPARETLRLLITDDMSDNRDVLRGLLEPLGFAVAEAGSGERCLELAPTWRPDLILMDLRMPGLDGLETTRRLRQLPECRETPVVVVSASAFGEDRSASRAAGCDAHLGKPVQRRELLATLENLLPLQWQYVAPPAAAPLAPPQAARFTHLVRTGDISGLLQFVEELEQSGDSPDFTATLGGLARNFDISGLHRLAQQYESS